MQRRMLGEGNQVQSRGPSHLWWGRGSEADTDAKQGESLSTGLSRTGPKRRQAEVYDSPPLDRSTDSKSDLLHRRGPAAQQCLGVARYVNEIRHNPLRTPGARSGASPHQLGASGTLLGRP